MSLELKCSHSKEAAFEATQVLNKLQNILSLTMKLAYDDDMDLCGEKHLKQWLWSFRNKTFFSRASTGHL